MSGPNSRSVEHNPKTRDLLDATVCKNGSWIESKLVVSYSFMRSSDINHAYYQLKLTEYRAQVQDIEPDSPDTDDDAVSSRTTQLSVSSSWRRDDHTQGACYYEAVSSVCLLVWGFFLGSFDQDNG